MNEIDNFKTEGKGRIENYQSDEVLRNASKDFLYATIRNKYSYNFTWMGRPIIQYPQDMVAMQEIIWKVKPDLIIETGIAHGGSLIMYASFLEMMNIEKGHVLGIDIDIKKHNRIEIERHPMFKRITMIEGSSISNETTEQVKSFAKDYKKIMLVLDSMHTHDHVLKELELYSNLVTKGSYCVVFDTVVEDLPEHTYSDRPWGKGNNPKTAACEFLKTHPEFEIDKSIQNKLLITVAPDGFLKKIK